MIHRKQTMKRILSILLALMLLVSMAACTDAPATTGVDLPSSNQTTGSVPTTQTQPIVPPTTVPEVPPTTLPEVPVDPESYVLKFTLSQEDVDEYYRLLKECEELSLLGEDMEAVDASVVALEEKFDYMNAQCTIAMIFNYSHTADKVLEKQYLDAVEICTNAQDAYLQMIKRVYLSDSPAKESLFEGWSQEDLDSLLNYNQRIVELQQRNAEIGVEYRTASDDKRMIQLYIAFALAVFIEDIRRFPTAKKLVSYFGLNPAVNASGEQERRQRRKGRGHDHLSRFGRADVKHLCA